MNDKEKAEYENKLKALNDKFAKHSKHNDYGSMLLLRPGEKTNFGYNGEICLFSCTDEAQGLIAEIFTNSERPDKIKVFIEDGNNVTIRCEDMDEEYTKELRESLNLQAIKIVHVYPTNLQQAIESGAKIGSHGERDYMRQIALDALAASAEPAAAQVVAIPEAKKLAPILRGLCEGGGEERHVDIYADDYQPSDGDVFVLRAADLLDELSAAPSLPQPSEQSAAPAPEAQDGQSELKYWREQNKNLMHLRSAVDGKTHAERIAALSAQPVAVERNKLLKIIGYAYQVAGFHNASQHVLDVLADPENATDEQIEAMLPCLDDGGNELQIVAFPKENILSSEEWQIVPKKLTKEMEDAIDVKIEAAMKDDCNFITTQDIWDAGLEVAPKTT